MDEIKILVHAAFKKSKISPWLYGSFVEHMGRVVYSGIYEPESIYADEDGFRKDILEKVKNMGITCVRYPGGNFVSTYDWRDGVGPKENRPWKREVAWKSIETNEFGTDEFMRWAKKADVIPVFAVNLGTKGIENAMSFLEYCNLPTGTFYSDMRAKNGHEKPYHVPVWCIGNEMDGTWQMGHKTADEYARLATQTAHAMKALDADIQTVVCGSSSTSMETYTDWERIVLEEAYDYVDYIALHQYYGGQEKGTARFLAQSLDLENYIHTVSGICDMVKSKKHGHKQINISIDEWGVWEIPGTDVENDVNSRDWEIAPALSEQIYTMEDSLLFASMLMAMVRNSNRVKIACQSLLTNISAAIMTEKGGESWVQPIYYPFSYMSKYGRGVVLESADQMETYEADGIHVPEVDSLAIYNEVRKEVVFFWVNRVDQKKKISIELQEFTGENIVEFISMHAERTATNQKQHDLVKPEEQKNVFKMMGNTVMGEIPEYSWNMLRIQV